MEMLSRARTGSREDSQELGGTRDTQEHQRRMWWRRTVGS
jgi:hypothetical protein